MTSLTCKHCLTSFTSLDLDPEKSLAEVSSSFNQHLKSIHPQQSALFIKAVDEAKLLSVWLILIANHTTLMDQEPSADNQLVFDQVDNVIEQIGERLGVDLEIADGDE